MADTALDGEDFSPGSREWYAARLYGSGKPVDPTSGKEKLNAFANEAAYMVPVVGESMSARDAWEASGEGGRALTEGRYRDAVGNYGNMLAATLGAVPVLGTLARGSKRVAAWMDKALPESVNAFTKVMPERPQDQTNIFAGPSAKTANHVALMRAQEMEAQGASRDEIWRATGWGKNTGGKWQFEIDDSGATLKDLGKGKVARFGGLEHPELEAAYGTLPPVYGMVNPRMPEEGSFLPGNRRAPPYIHAQGRTPESAKGVALHEFQHGAQSIERFETGGNPSSFARDLPSGGRDDGYDTYRRLAGEVEARNVQTRMNMTAAERRNAPPWQTQDVPDDQQLVRNSFANNRPQMSAEPPRDLGNAFSREAGTSAPANDMGGRVVPMREGAGPVETAKTSDISNYAGNRLSVGGDTAIPVETVYADYAKRAEAAGETPAPMMAFIRHLRDQGIFPQQIAGKTRYFATLND